VPADRVPTGLDEAAALYRSHVAGRRTLVLLDNACSAEQVRPLLPGGCDSRVVVTSRDRLTGLVARDGAHRLGLDVLTPDESVALLERIVGTRRLAAERPVATDLADLCGRLPLALRIAAANLADQPGRRLADYLARLRQGNRLTALQVEGDEPTGVRVAFEQSYAVLAPAARRLFRLMGLVRGPDVSVAAAAALTDGSIVDTQHMLDVIARAHLITAPAPDRYSFHDLLRIYARERAVEEDSGPDRAAALGRLFDHYLQGAGEAARLAYPDTVRLPPPTAVHTASVGFGDDTPALSWLDAERPNLVAAVSHAAEHGSNEVAWLLADALRGYFDLRPPTADWLTSAQAALTAAEAEGATRAQAAAHQSLATYHWSQDRHDRAVDHQRRALALARSAGWTDGEGIILGNLACMYGQLGQPEQAARHIQQALVIDRRTGAVAGLAIHLSNLGRMYSQPGRLPAAVDACREALAGFRKVGSRPGAVAALGNLGEAYHGLGRLPEATEALTEALCMARDLGNQRDIADALRCLAAVRRDAGHYPHALDLAGQALALSRDFGERRYEAEALCTLASVHHRTGAPGPAADLYDRALRLARKTANRHCETEALLGLAATCHALGKRDLALDHAERALAAARDAGFRLLEERAGTVLAAVCSVAIEPG